MYLGRRIFSSGSTLSDRTRVAVFPTDFNVWLVAFTTPAVGLATTPRRPVAVPLKNPPTPPFCAPLIGSITMPLMPPKTPIPMLLAPESNPSPMCFGCDLLLCLLLSMNSSSIDNTARPLLTAPVTLLAAPNVVEMVVSSSAFEPFATPVLKPKIPGFSTIPLAGSRKKDITPSAMFSNAPAGLPRIAIPKTTLYHCANKSFL
mmetsp:Transcript_16707/g.31609  ORF Transcript_16707/g.31609 Transcript_16707/m.31609 type:complete len:203 (+) Transcript_16707:733-1341(+)